MTKLKMAAVVIFPVLVILTAIFLYQYQNILIADSAEGQLMNQIRLVKVEYNSSDPLTITGTHDGGFFNCNFTIQNPTNSSFDFLGISALFYRDRSHALYLIAQGGGSGGDQQLTPGNHSFSVRMMYLSYTELPPDNFTTPVFQVTTTVKEGFSARNVYAETSGSVITNWGATSRSETDETFQLIYTYASLPMVTWILGLSLTLIIELITARRTSSEIEQIAGFSLLLIPIFILCIWSLQWIPYPQPYRATGISVPSGGVAGLMILVTIFFAAMTALSLASAFGFLFHQGWAEATAILVAVLFAISFFLPFSGTVWQASYFAVLITIIIALIMNRCRRKTPTSQGMSESAPAFIVVLVGWIKLYPQTQTQNG
jgi:hypothetical protein